VVAKLDIVKVAGVDGVVCRAAPGTESELRQHLHDVKGAVARFASIIAAVEGGYRFDEATGPRMVALLKEAVATLKEEMNLLDEIYPR
jgi:hypothetical protein